MYRTPTYTYTCSTLLSVISTLISVVSTLLSVISTHYTYTKYIFSPSVHVDASAPIS